MGLGIYVEDPWRGRLSEFADDAAESFMRLCQDAPEETLRRGINRYGETLFNVIQTRPLLRELEALPEDAKTPVVHQVIAGAKQAIERLGYLHFVGD
ncbi:hypothetical protein AB0M57_31460 [Streptomyces sp. NPDC051597]|uniref:hypothetical protein n=1 Tax=Streptomyces sp. NPDC051597 TaxID=3155049 RepID=UPI0034225F60